MSEPAKRWMQIDDDAWAALCGRAHELHDLGLHVVPLRSGRGKIPAVKWRAYQSERASDAQVASWYSDGAGPGRRYGLAVVLGSGGLEMLEAEGRAMHLMPEVERAMAKAGLSDTWRDVTMGHAERSPSGGVHWLYRITDTDVPGNSKIARDEPTEYDVAGNLLVGRDLFETRGTGGIVIVAPTPASACHPSPSPLCDWELVAGGPTRAARLTAEERDGVIEVLAGFNLDTSKPPTVHWASLDRRETQRAARSKKRRRVTPHVGYAPIEYSRGAMALLRPDRAIIARYQQLTGETIEDILEGEGWQLLYEDAEGVCQWEWHGTNDGRPDVSTGFAGQPLLHTWVDSIPGLEQDRSYPYGAVLAALRHGGDWPATVTACHTALGREAARTMGSTR